MLLSLIVHEVDAARWRAEVLRVGDRASAVERKPRHGRDKAAAHAAVAEDSCERHTEAAHRTPGPLAEKFPADEHGYRDLVHQDDAFLAWDLAVRNLPSITIRGAGLAPWVAVWLPDRERTGRETVKRQETILHCRVLSTRSLGGRPREIDAT
jgi:hypothetical protein